MEKQDMITSKEIIEQTGISRATLNNYIKMGILPKPIAMLLALGAAQSRSSTSTHRS